MKLSVYYDEIDGRLTPQWMLLPATIDEEFATYSIEAPFERFWPEDFHDSMAVITVTQAAMVRNPFNTTCFSIFVPRVLEDLITNDSSIGHLHEAEYFLVRLEDLEEVLQMNIHSRFIINSSD